MSGFAYVVRGTAAEAVAFKEAVDCDADLVWVHLSTNDEQAKAWLSGRAGLSTYVTEALTAAETRPRCDAIGDGAVINLRGLSSEALAASDPLASIRVHAFGGRVFSVTRKPLNALVPVREQMEAGRIVDPGDLIAAIAQAITEELDPMVAELGDSLDDCEERIATKRIFALRTQVSQVRSRAIGYRRFLHPQRAAIEKLAALPVGWLSDEDRLHLGAAADRAARMAEELDSIRERAALTHETLTDLRAEQIDQRSLVIAIVAMVFLPLTFLTGLLGMNVQGIPFADAHWAFWGVVGVCVAMGAAITAFFVRRHWLEH